ncbi:E3 ubiquitin-protein ligase NEURL3 [Lampris incognitus]|uniref:E3 ubiquitin-protein ligase NEURL3 n=1 Tax=Lampris incognitus TaxID=2546036 RepID=UPI0024B5EF6D|nr:E3 ubiquitin-protein ligase NEURL3 [Lampris incognitus]
MACRPDSGTRALTGSTSRTCCTRRTSRGLPGSPEHVVQRQAERTRPQLLVEHVSKHWSHVPKFYCLIRLHKKPAATSTRGDGCRGSFTRDTRDAMMTANKMVLGDPGSDGSHKCRVSCLGPLSFHSQALGTQVSLSHHNCLAERAESTFKQGLVFSSRPLRVRERVRLRVAKSCNGWHGALRLGFTTTPPTGRPLPSLVIPDLTDVPGHWAAAIPEVHCDPGSELEFWVSHGGNMYVKWNNGTKYKLLKGVDLSRPLWAMIDVYGQTSSVLLLGSAKKEMLQIRRSCPVPIPSTTKANDHNSLNDVLDLYCGSMCLWEDMDDSYPYQALKPDPEVGRECVVCMTREATLTLLCGHNCLCHKCGHKVIQEFGTCPLCRQKI